MAGGILGNRLVTVRSIGEGQQVLQLVPGTHVQAWDADLDTLAALTATANSGIIGNGSTWTTAPLVTQAEAEAGTLTAVRMWSPLRVAQAIAALESGGGGASISVLDGATTVVSGVTVLKYDANQYTITAPSTGVASFVLAGQAQATWDAGSGTTETVISPAKLSGAITALGGGGGGSTLIAIQSFTSTGTATVTLDASTLTCDIYVTGGGGGGGGIDLASGTGAAPGGGAGSTAIKYRADKADVDGATVTIGAGGAGGTGSGAPSVGGNSSVVKSGGVNIVASGAALTQSATAVSGYPNTTYGTHSSDSGGDIYFTGIAPGNGQIDAAAAVGGQGGGSYWGHGGVGPWKFTSGVSNGNAAVTKGSGGSGACAYNSGTAANGGAGAGGVVYIFEWG